MKIEVQIRDVNGAPLAKEIIDVDVLDTAQIHVRYGAVGEIKPKGVNPPANYIYMDVRKIFNDNFVINSK